jgi:anti-sigma B factor antagonist
MEISERTSGNVTIVDLNGRLNLGDATVLLHDKINSLIQQERKNIILNLADVASVDSGGLGELVRTLTTMQKHGGSLKVANLPKRVQDLLVMTRLVTVFETFEDEGAAIKSFSST